jgi:hypothetical protein
VYHYLFTVLRSALSSSPIVSNDRIPRLISYGTTTCSGVAGVGSGVGWRPADTLAGGAVGVVASAGVCSWPPAVAGRDGQGVGRVAAGDAFAPVGGGWRSAVATTVHEQRVL